MVHLTNSDLAESLRMMSIPPKTIEIRLTENDTNKNDQADESKLTEQKQNSSQAMMKSATPMLSGTLPNVPEQPSQRYLLKATLSDKEPDKNLPSGFNKKKRSKTNRVLNQNHVIQPNFVP